MDKKTKKLLRDNQEPMINRLSYYATHIPAWFLPDNSTGCVALSLTSLLGEMLFMSILDRMKEKKQLYLCQESSFSAQRQKATTER